MFLQELLCATGNALDEILATADRHVFHQTSRLPLREPVSRQSIDNSAIQRKAPLFPVSLARETCPMEDDPGDQTPRPQARQGHWARGETKGICCPLRWHDSSTGVGFLHLHSPYDHSRRASRSITSNKLSTNSINLSNNSPTCGRPDRGFARPRSALTYRSCWSQCGKPQCSPQVMTAYHDIVQTPNLVERMAALHGRQTRVLPSLKSRTVSQICSFICRLSMLIMRAPNSTPMVKSCTGWNLLSVNCSSRQDLPTPE